MFHVRDTYDDSGETGYVATHIDPDAVDTFRKRVTEFGEEDAAGGREVTTKSSVNVRTMGGQDLEGELKVKNEDGEMEAKELSDDQSARAATDMARKMRAEIARREIEHKAGKAEVSAELDDVLAA